MHGLKVSQLLQIIAQAVGKGRQRGFRGFHINKGVGLVGGLVNRGATEFGKAERL